MLKFRLRSDGTAKVLLCRRALKLEMKSRRSDDGLVIPSLLLCNERMGGGVGHKVRAYGVNSGCATVYMPRPSLRSGSSSCPTQGYSNLHSLEDFSPTQIYSSTSDSPHPFAAPSSVTQLSIPLFPSYCPLICFVQPLWGL